MKFPKFIFSILTFILVLITLCGCQAKNVPIEYKELGIPTEKYFTPGTDPCCPWDMICFDNKLFIGSGNYGKNVGPIEMFYYDIEQEKWDSAGSANDEEISRFVIIDGKLIAPGIDPRDSWSHGSHYEYDPEKVLFKKHRTIPGGLHVFDLVECDGKIFAGLGVEDGRFPVAYSTDGGRCFNILPFYKDGVAVDSTGDYQTRVYDMVVFKNEVYAAWRRLAEDKTMLSWDFYKYDDGKFVYYSEYGMDKLGITRVSHNFLGAKVEFNEKMYFAAGDFYSTTDLINFDQINLPDTTIVADLIIKDDVLYALGHMQNEDGTYRISVHKCEGEDFKEIFYFNYGLPAISFEYDGNNFYFGIGIKHEKYDLNGMILSVKYK